jgi:hypothetical protein
MNARFPLLLAALSATATAQVRFTELAAIDLTSTAAAANPEFIGTNPSAVAWDGTRLFVSGNNNSGGAQAQNYNCSIVEILNPLSGTPGYGPVFGTIDTPPVGRGYLGLDIQGNRIAAAYDPGAAHPQGIAAYDLAGTPLWAKNARGGSGVGFDPGALGTAAGRGVGWTTFGSTSRALQDAVSGADVYTTTNGMSIDAGEGTFWRDIDFDDATGDVWLREGNNVIHAVRSGPNLTARSVVVYDANPDADFVIQQNVAFCGTPTGAFVIYNDRAFGSSNQGFFQTVIAIRPDGSPLVPDWGAFNPQPGTAAYDFSYDAGSNTLAILDSGNRMVHLFQVDLAPYFPYGSGCQGSNGLTPELVGLGAGTVGTQLTYQVRSGVANGSAFLIMGAAQGSLPLYTGCELLVAPVLPFSIGPIVLDGSGAGSTALQLIPAAAGVTLTAQAVMLDVGVTAPLPFILSNGLQIDVP